MVKRALEGALLAALPIGALLAGCSNGDAAENAPLQTVGDHSTRDSSNPLRPVPSDAELQQQITGSANEPAATASPNSSASNSTARKGSPPSSPSTQSADDPYLPPQAYIPSDNAPSKQQSPSPVEPSPRPVSAPVEDNGETASLSPRKPVPLFPVNGDDQTPTSTPGDHSGEPIPEELEQPVTSAEKPSTVSAPSTSQVGPTPTTSSEPSTSSTPSAAKVAPDNRRGQHDQTEQSSISRLRSFLTPEEPTADNNS